MLSNNNISKEQKKTLVELMINELDESEILTTDDNESTSKRTKHTTDSTNRI
jgi:hypothetical protein